jgi:hypothetical protein
MMVKFTAKEKTVIIETILTIILLKENKIFHKRKVKNRFKLRNKKKTKKKIRIKIIIEIINIEKIILIALI